MSRRLRRERVAFALVTSLTVLGGAVAGRPPQAPERILFLGNSYTYYNNLPCLVSELARSRGRTLETVMMAAGGASLGDLWEREDVRAALQQRWTAVILQTQSTFGRAFLVDGLERVSDTSALLREARRIADAVSAQQTRVLLFAHWKRRDAPDRDQMAVDDAFDGAARSLGAAVVPAGLAWELAQSTVRASDLYDADGSHPSRAGSYLAAVTTVSALTGIDPAGLPASVTCPTIDMETARPTDDAVTLTVDPAVALTLQRAASEATHAWTTGTGRTVPALALPELPAGTPPGAADLQGRWVGTTEVYPRFLLWPARMELVFLSHSSATLAVSFGGRPDDIVRDVAVSASRGTIAFEDPRGPNGTVIVYRGVRQGDTLTGIAEFTGSEALRGVGRWTLRRP